MKQNHAIDAAIDFVGGCAGGTASVYVGQPLDTVKVKMQTFPTLYTNAFRCFVQTLKQDGIARGLYAGTLPSLAAQVSENAVLFFSYGMCQKAVMILSQKNTVMELNAVENALAGSSAGFFAAIALCPTELIKCKLQAMREMTSIQGSQTAVKRIGPWGVTKDILRTEGIQGMFRGMIPTLVREMIGYSFFFGGYELCRMSLTPPGASKDELSPIKTIVCGGMGGVAFWTATFPADVIKSRVQVQGHVNQQSFLFALIHIARTEGVLALYNGLGPSLLRTFPATGMLFLAYETTKKYLKVAVYEEEHIS